jgi:hypothetical protein
LPPKPSVRPSEIFFLPHQDGTAVGFADDEVATASVIAAESRAKTAMVPFLLRVI